MGTHHLLLEGKVKCISGTYGVGEVKSKYARVKSDVGSMKPQQFDKSTVSNFVERSPVL